MEQSVFPAGCRAFTSVENSHADFVRIAGQWRRAQVHCCFDKFMGYRKFGQFDRRQIEFMFHRPLSGQLKKADAHSAIVGTALYEKTLDLKAALSAC